MAIYHFQVQIVSRGKGKSSVAAAAYRSGEKLVDERTGLEHDYTKKQGIEYTEIVVPSNAPNWAIDRNRLWNEVEKIEKSKNSQLAREINIALPIDLSKEQQKELIKEFVKENFVKKGMVADIAIHNKVNENPHAHVMLTVRPFNEDGTWGAKAKKEYILNKNGEKIKKGKDFKSIKIESTDWNKKETMENWREQWANHANKALEKAGIAERIDHRSLKEQGIEREAQIHVGVHANAMEKKGITTEKGTMNREIKKRNEQIKAIEKEKVIALQEYRELKDKLEQKKTREAQKYSNLKPEEKAALQKVERILKEPQTYENSNKALNKLNTMRQDSVSKLSKINFQVGVVGRRLKSINYSLEELKRAENELKKLPKGIFGQYKDKDRAEILKNNIQGFNSNLTSDGYKSNVDIKLNENSLESLQKNSEKLKLNIQVIDHASNTIKIGVKVLQRKELREFHKEYKKQFPQANYLKYNDMKAIKKATKLMDGLVSIKEIVATYRKNGKRADSIDKELKDIENNGIRLINAKQSIETIDKYKDIADKWDTKIFGKAKFQEEHRAEKWQYDNAKADLKTYGVRDKFDLRNQERTHECNLKDIQPKIQAERVAITPSLSILSDVLTGLNNALKTEKAVQRQQDLKLTKAFKGKNMEDEL